MLRRRRKRGTLDTAAEKSAPLALRRTSLRHPAHVNAAASGGAAGQGRPRAHATQTAREKLPRFWTGPDHGVWLPDPKILPRNHVTKRDLFSESVGNSMDGCLVVRPSARPWLAMALASGRPALSLPAVPPALRLCESLGPWRCCLLLHARF